MFRHHYTCMTCGTRMSIQSASPTNPIAGTICTHINLANYGKEVDSSSGTSFPVGIDVDGVSAPSRHNNCYGSLKHGETDILETVSPQVVVAPPSPHQEAAQEVYDDMRDQFNRWDGSRRNRGAWWGSDGPGDTSGAKNVPMPVVTALRGKCTNTSWRYSDSFSGGISFHKSSGDIDFIYHMKAP